MTNIAIEHGPVEIVDFHAKARELQSVRKLSREKLGDGCGIGCLTGDMVISMGFIAP